MQNGGNSLIGAFVGNKCEFRDGSIDSRAEVGVNEAKEMADSIGLAYFETSAVSFYINYIQYLLTKCNNWIQLMNKPKSANI